MSTVTHATNRVKPNRLPRTVRIVEPATEPNGWMAVEIEVGDDTTTYLVRPIPADFGYGYEIEKLGDGFEVVTTYHVNLMGGESSCTCKGMAYHGHCRHVEALAAIQATGRLPRYVVEKKPAKVCPWCLDPHEDGGLCRGCAAHEDAYLTYHQGMMAVTPE